MMATAEQTVSAVLDATNKRYLVESGTSEDGAIWYDLYSDGWLVQGGLLKSGVLTLPKSYRDMNFTITSNIKSGVNDFEWTSLIGVKSLSPSTIKGGSTHISELTFVCQGYAA